MLDKRQKTKTPRIKKRVALFLKVSRKRETKVWLSRKKVLSHQVSSSVRLLSKITPKIKLSLNIVLKNWKITRKDTILRSLLRTAQDTPEVKLKNINWISNKLRKSMLVTISSLRDFHFLLSEILPMLNRIYSRTVVRLWRSLRLWMNSLSSKLITRLPEDLKRSSSSVL